MRKRLRQGLPSWLRQRHRWPRLSPVASPAAVVSTLSTPAPVVATPSAAVVSASMSATAVVSAASASAAVVSAAAPMTAALVSDAASSSSSPHAASTKLTARHTPAIRMTRVRSPLNIGYLRDVAAQHATRLHPSRLVLSPAGTIVAALPRAMSDDSRRARHRSSHRRTRRLASSHVLEQAELVHPVDRLAA